MVPWLGPVARGCKITIQKSWVQTPVKSSLGCIYGSIVLLPKLV